MILLIDVGNTQVKWRCLDVGGFIGGGQRAHQGNLSSDILHKMWDSLDTPSAVWGVNVAGGGIAEQIRQWCLSNWRLLPEFITSSKHLAGVTNGYQQAEKLGADRWMALVGADSLVEGACCVADCGSAVTVDCMNEAHEHIGGLIIPGLAMMPLCVSKNTAQVTYSPGAISWLGNDTASCLASGAVQSVVGAILRTVEIMEKKFSSHVNRIITGGDALQLLPWLGNGWRHEPDLIFIGLSTAIKSQQG